MRPITLLSLTFATLLGLHGCRSGPSALELASRGPATPTATSTAPSSEPATPAPATTTPASSGPTMLPTTPSNPTTPATSAPTPVTPKSPTTPTSPVVVNQPQGSPECLAGCNSPSLAPEVQSTCRVQCARLAQQSTTTPTSSPTTPTTSGPDLAHQRQLCESQCDAERDASDRSTCRLQCNQMSSAGNGYPYTGNTGGNTSGTSGGANRQQEIAACQSTCDREASPTDRATCRNNCGAYGTWLGSSGPSGWVSGTASVPSDADQRAAVIRSSGGVVSGGQPTTSPGYQQPNPQCAAQAQSCRLTCANDQNSCSAGCDQGKMSETDRATCKLTCSGAGDTCRDDCRIKEGNCKPAVYK